MLVWERQEVQALPQGHHGRVVRGTVSARRDVPADIERPPWADTGAGSNRAEPDVKSPDVIERMRRTGRAAAEVLAEVGGAIAPGITTDELDAICHDACVAGAATRVR